MESRFASLFLKPYREYVDEQCKQLELAYEESVCSSERFLERYRALSEAKKKVGKKKPKKERLKNRAGKQKPDKSIDDGNTMMTIEKRSCAVQLTRISEEKLKAHSASLGARKDHMENVLADDTKSNKSKVSMNECNVYLKKIDIGKSDDCESTLSPVRLNKKHNSTVETNPSKQTHENRKRLVEAQQEKKRLAIEEQLRKKAEASERRIECNKKRLQEAIALKSKELKERQNRAMKLRQMFYDQKIDIPPLPTNCVKSVNVTESSTSAVAVVPQTQPFLILDSGKNTTSVSNMNKVHSKNPDNYSIDDLNSCDDTDPENSPIKERPAWASKEAIAYALKVAPPAEEVFKIFPAIDLESVFGPEKAVSHRYRERTSSVLWATFQSTMLEDSLLPKTPGTPKR